MSYFVPNPRLESELKRWDEMADAMGEVAEMGAQTAEQLAPVETGAYRASISSTSGIEDGAQGRINADDEASPFIEFGTVDTPTFAPLRRAAETLGKMG